MTATATQQPGDVAWYAQSAQEVTARLGADVGEGLAAAEVERRLAEYGPNELPAEPPPSRWAVARGQLANPMTIMLLIVVAATALSVLEWGPGQPSTTHASVNMTLSLLAPAVVAADKVIQLRRQPKILAPEA